MRILMVQETDWLKKGPFQQHHLLERLKLRGHQVRVIDYEVKWRVRLPTDSRALINPRRTFSAKPKTCDGPTVDLVRPFMIRLQLLDYASMAISHTLEIQRQLTEFRPDVVLGFSILNSYVAMKLAQRRGIPFFYYLIDEYHKLIPERILQSLGKALVFQLLRNSDLVFVLTRNLGSYSISCGADPHRVILLPAGVDRNSFNPDISGATIRKRFDVGTEDVLMLFMGWLYRFTGVKEVVKSLLSEEFGIPIRLMVVGRGELSKDLAKMQRSARDKLILVDWVDYNVLPEYIASSDVCLLPSPYGDVVRNIVPIKTYEYMSCGKPVVATRLPGIVDEFGYGNGIVYADSPEQIVRTVASLGRNKENLRRLGSRAAAYVENHNWDQKVTEFERILTETATSKKKQSN